MPDSPTTPASPASPASPATPPEPPPSNDGPVMNAIGELKAMVQDLLGKVSESAPVTPESTDETPQGVPWTHRGGKL